MYPIKKINNLAFPIIITKLGEVEFSIQFVHMFHRRFGNAMHVLLCKSNW